MKQIKLIENFEARIYQQSIFANAINKNTLVILPTGLGKTIIAIMLSVYYYNNTKKKVLFLAPTKPLVEQQEKSFKSFFKNSNEFNFQVLTGLVSPKKRKELYDKNDFIFSTPQLIENDIINRIIDPKNFCFVTIDEAHRGVGNYAYTFIANQFNKSNVKILALTASPGTSREEIDKVMEELKIEHIEVKKYDDSDVKPYIKQTKIESVKVELDDTFKKIKNNLNKTLIKKVNQLKELGFLPGKHPEQISKTDLLDLQRYLRVDLAKGNTTDKIWKGISISAGLMKLQYGIELFESQEVSVAYNYFYNFFRLGGDNSKAAEELKIDVNFREAFDEISKLNKNNIKHPKLMKLKEIVHKEILQNSELRIIIFSQYRDSAQKIVEELSQIKEIKPALFVGQAKKGDLKMSQKEQKKILDDFRNGDYNIIVSTSVGEEGLDIPKVDLVIFYEPVPSAIRTIQRIGRTGRFNKGKAYILQTQGTRDIITKHIASAKEKKMYKVLKEIQNEKQKIKGNKNEGLNKYIKETKDESINSNPQSPIPNPSSPISDGRILIYIDNRENNDLTKQLFNLDDIKVQSKQLEIGDIVISEIIAIERKSKKDFVNSIIDKRLFPQLLNLTKNYKRPVLIIEGEESLYTIRNINPNVIRATLSAIAIDLRIPIIYTNSLEETAFMIQTIARRTIKPKKDISLAGDKMAFSQNEELEKFVSTIPKVNVVSAKSLLEHFGSVKELVNSNKEQLIECEGIGKKRAEFLVEFFKREYKK